MIYCTSRFCDLAPHEAEAVIILPAANMVLPSCEKRARMYEDVAMSLPSAYPMRIYRRFHNALVR